LSKNTLNNAFVLWFTGLSGSGKSTLADRVNQLLEGKNLKLQRLDGDILRGLFPSTGFTKQERDDHIKRVGYMASVLQKHGVCVIASFISPYSEARNFVRNMCKNFIEVYVDCPLDECINRDVKGLYHKAQAGEIKNFTGIDDPYEPPENPEILVDTQKLSLEESAEVIMNYLEKYF